MSALPPWFGGLSYAGLLGVIFLTGAGLPLPEDVAVLGAGYLVHRGATTPLPTIAVALVGVLAGDLFLYALGRRWGRRVLEHPRVAGRIGPERLARAESFFVRFGVWAVVAARFVVGLRMAAYLAAGVLRMDLRRFIVADLAAALVNVPLLVALGWWAGPGVDRVAAWVAGARWAALGVLVAALGIAVLWARQRRRQRQPP